MFKMEGRDKKGANQLTTAAQNQQKKAHSP